MVASTAKLFTYACPLEKVEECTLILCELILFKVACIIIKPHSINIIKYKNVIQKEKLKNRVKKGVRTKV